jgi:hypothetical protein
MCAGKKAKIFPNYYLREYPCRLIGPDPKGVTGDVQLVMMGSGDERYSNFLRRYIHV